jgi:hypothetical protein
MSSSIDHSRWLTPAAIAGVTRTGQLAYTWTASNEGSPKRRFYRVLGNPPITSGADAVRAAIVAESKR